MLAISLKILLKIPETNKITLSNFSKLPRIPKASATGTAKVVTAGCKLGHSRDNPVDRMCFTKTLVGLS